MSETLKHMRLPGSLPPLPEGVIVKYYNPPSFAPKEYQGEYYRISYKTTISFHPLVDLPPGVHWSFNEEFRVVTPVAEVFTDHGDPASVLMERIDKFFRDIPEIEKKHFEICARDVLVAFICTPSDSAGTFRPSIVCGRGYRPWVSNGVLFYQSYDAGILLSLNMAKWGNLREVYASDEWKNRKQNEEGARAYL